MAPADEKKKRKPKTGEVIPVLKRVLSENAREFIPHYLVAILCITVVAGATALIPWVMRPLIDDMFYREQFDLVPVICATLAGIFVARGIATYGEAIVLAMIGNNLVARYQRRIFDHLMRLGLDFYNDQRSGQLAARINQNVLGVRDLLGMTLKSIVGDLTLLIALVISMIVLDPLLSMIVLLIGPPLIFAVNKIMRRLRSVARQAVLVNARLVGAMQEATQGIAVVKAFTMEGQLAQKMSALVDDAEERANKIARVSERVTPISEILAGVAVSGVVAYAAYRASNAGQPPGSVFGFITALLLAYDPARKLARMQVGLERSLVNARMIYELLDTEPRQRDAPNAAELQVTRGEVRFERVAFSYLDDLAVLHGVSFTAEAGKTTAIVGGSGAGKSTLIALTQRFYDLAEGAILIDGQDIAGVTKESLRGSIAYVSQHPYLFEGTIRDNIRYGRPEATDAEVEEAARLAHADEFIRQSPGGYEAPVGENGVTLSGGQRQRLSIARAIVRDAPILLLDEATSALDNESEARVQAALETVMQDRTTIVIAHRLSTVKKADKIVVMEDGRIIEEGSHATLMKNRHGIYYRYNLMLGDKSLELTNDREPGEAPGGRAAGAKP